MSSKTNKPVWRVSTYEERMAEYAAQASRTEADYAMVRQILNDAVKSGVFSKEKGNDNAE